MASSSLCFVRFSPSSPPPIRCFHGVRISPSPTTISFSTKLGSSASASVSGSPLVLRSSQSIPCLSRNPSGLVVFASKGYKMKTHKASAKRFRVTGRGKIVRRRAGKQHLLWKKNTKRKLRLSKMAAVNKSDYNNVIGALPYLKVNRKAV